METPQPCQPSPCGANAQCREQNRAGSCTCLPDYIGNPYEGCRPECVLNSDCPPNKSCVRNKCQNECPGACGQNADCQVINHLASCTCRPGYTGDPFRYCNIQPPERKQFIEHLPFQSISNFLFISLTVAVEADVTNPCSALPCGPNSQCREVNGQAVCSCLPNYIGSPPNCRPECVTSSECPITQACTNQKCSDPCLQTCGLNAKCKVINHSPICSCDSGYTGDPFTRCYLVPRKSYFRKYCSLHLLICIRTAPRPPPETPVYVNPCVPSPCGTYSECRDIGGSPSCSCLPTYIGTPPNCRPECSINAECSSNRVCMRQKCQTPCPYSCGAGAQCNVINHTPICTCPEGYTGDPFSNCYPKPPPPPEPVELDKCNPSPCGPNSQCNNGICTCLPEYQGDPYSGCRPECVLNDDCPRDKACIRNKCVPACEQICGQNAECSVINHIPMCSCPSGFTGNAFIICRPVQAAPVVTNPCNPSPCGPNSQCREINGQGVCSCVPGFIGSPPTCRPECVSSAECPLNQACVNQKCIDICEGSCGVGARCQVVNHNPICSCPQRMTGDPFNRCQPISRNY